MNKLEATVITAPDGKIDECAKFTINDADSTFTMTNVVSIDTNYVLHFWIKSDAAGSITANDNEIQTSTVWNRHVQKFRSSRKDIVILFKAPGVYYLYNSKLESGNVDTDWTPAPEDVQQDINDTQTSANNVNNKIDQQIPNIEFAKSQIEILNKSIASLVVDQNGGSLMTQTPDGWKFNIGAIQSSLDGAVADIQDIQGDISGVNDLANKTNQLANDLASKTAYINMTQDDLGQPVMELGQQNGEFKLRITNTSMDFMQGSQRIAYLSNRQLYIQSSVVTDEMKIGGGTSRVIDCDFTQASDLDLWTKYGVSTNIDSVTTIDKASKCLVVSQTDVGSNAMRIHYDVDRFSHISGRRYTLRFLAKSINTELVLQKNVFGSLNIKEFNLKPDTWIQYEDVYTASSEGSLTFWLTTPGEYCITNIVLEVDATGYVWKKRANGHMGLRYVLG